MILASVEKFMNFLSFSFFRSKLLSIVSGFMCNPKRHVMHAMAVIHDDFYGILPCKLFLLRIGWHGGNLSKQVHLIYMHA